VRVFKSNFLCVGVVLGAQVAEKADQPEGGEQMAKGINRKQAALHENGLGGRLVKRCT
jgi:hypothetical protein